KKLVTVSQEQADKMMARVAASKGDYLDLLSDKSLNSRNGPMYYFPQDVLNRLNQKYDMGTLPVSGTTTDGRPFQMQAMVVGDGEAHYLYNQPRGCSFEQNGTEFKIGDGGHVAAQVQGPGDVAIQGVSGCGNFLFFSGCQDVQRITKISTDQVRVQTDGGEHTLDVPHVTRRTQGFAR